MVYQISYDLRGPEADYDDLYNIINSQGDVLRILGSTWLIESCKTAEQITDEISVKIKKGDRFFISQINLGQYNGWHSRSTWDWISARLNPNTNLGQTQVPH